MNGVTMAFGNRVFKASGPSHNQIVRSFEQRIEQVDLIGRQPAHQNNGPGEATISVEGVVFPLHGDGYGMLEKLQEDMASGTTRMLVSGFGKSFGRFALRSISITEELHTPQGVPQKMAYTLEFVRVASASRGSSNSPFNIFQRGF
jgi:uncharacterized protein